ncbi:MAG: hypothetical protein K2I95_00535 [Treponemataceae bacterium]|nr:hypothetical protein [Treponemataceae bacterium]
MKIRKLALIFTVALSVLFFSCALGRGYRAYGNFQARIGEDFSALLEQVNSVEIYFQPFKFLFWISENPDFDGLLTEDEIRSGEYSHFGTCESTYTGEQAEYIAAMILSAEEVKSEKIGKRAPTKQFGDEAIERTLTGGMVIDIVFGISIPDGEGIFRSDEYGNSVLTCVAQNDGSGAFYIKGEDNGKYYRLPAVLMKKLCFNYGEVKRHIKKKEMLKKFSVQVNYINAESL